MTNITKELRMWGKDMLPPRVRGNGKPHLIDQLFAIADRIDAELAKQYIALPLDMDGKPIHFGDVMQMDGDSKLREVVGFHDGGFFFAWSNGRFVPCAASFYRHAKPDTWECIIYDAMQAGRTEETIDVTPLIERCKELAEKEMS